MRTIKAQTACTSVLSDQRLCCSLLSISLVSISEVSSLYLASVAVQAGLSLTWSQIPEDRFSHDKAHLMYCRYVIQPSSMFAIPTRLNRKRFQPKPKASGSTLRDGESENDSSDPDGKFGLPDHKYRSQSLPATELQTRFAGKMRFQIGTVENAL